MEPETTKQFHESEAKLKRQTVAGAGQAALTGSAADGPVKELRHARPQGPKEMWGEAPGLQKGCRDTNSSM